jgi:hypothetical protein
MKYVLPISIAFLFAASCSPNLSATSAPPTEVSRRTFTPIPTLTGVPLQTPTPAGSLLPVSTLTPVPASTYVPFSVATIADNVALRKGPGYLFLRIGLLPERTSLRVLSRSHGGEWAMVQTTDDRVGWVFVQLTEASGVNWAGVPFSEPFGAQLITGSVGDQAGVPISGIQFALTQGNGALAPRNDAMTDETGTFYAYMPANASGPWYLSYTAIACSSNTMDASCNPKNGVGGRPYPEGQYIALPLATQTTLQFVWR